VNSNSRARSAISSPTYALSKQRCCCRSGVGAGRSMGMLASVSSTILPSGRLAPSTATPIGTPSPSTNRLRLTPCLARSVGFFPVFFPPERRFGHAAVHAHPGPVDPFPIVISQETGFPQSPKNTSFHPFLKPIVGSRTGNKTGSVQCLPLTTRAKHKKYGLHALTVGFSGPAATKAMCIFVFGKKQSNAFPQIVGDVPLVHGRHIHVRSILHGCTSGVQRRRANSRLLLQLYRCSCNSDRLLGSVEIKECPNGIKAKLIHGEDKRTLTIVVECQKDMIPFNGTKCIRLVAHNAVQGM
jgi:hypothetical protein